MIVQGDNGTEIIVTISDTDGVVDLSTAREITAVVRRGAGDSITKIFTILDAVSGTCKTMLTADDVSRAGEYTMQVTVTFAGGSVFSSDLHRFGVNRLLSTITSK